MFVHVYRQVSGLDNQLLVGNSVACPGNLEGNLCCQCCCEIVMPLVYNWYKLRCVKVLVEVGSRWGCGASGRAI